MLTGTTVRGKRGRGSCEGWLSESRTKRCRISVSTCDSVGERVGGPVERVLVEEVLVMCFTYLSGIEIATTVRNVSRDWWRLSHSSGTWTEVRRRFRHIRDNPKAIPHPCDSLSFKRLASDLNEEDYEDTVAYYWSLFTNAISSSISGLKDSLEDMPECASEMEKWWWHSPRPSFRRARLMWQRLAEDSSMRVVHVGTDHIEEQLSTRNTFPEFQYEVGTLWSMDLYILLGMIPEVHSPEAGEGGCNCDMHCHAMEGLVNAERHFCLPGSLLLHSSDHHSFCSGAYTLGKGKVNGYPFWVKGESSETEVTAERGTEAPVLSSAALTDASSSQSVDVAVAVEEEVEEVPASWLYSSPCGVWTFSNREVDFSTGAGHIAAASKHNGWLPQTNREWLHGNGSNWTPDGTISVRSVPVKTSFFLARQADVNPRMRSFVVGWLSDVQYWSRGPLPMHAHFLTVMLTDKFLGARHVQKDELQLLACAAAVIANKVEGPIMLGEAGPSILERMWVLCNKMYSLEQIKAKAEEVTEVLGPDAVRHPTVYLFLERYLDLLRERDQLHPLQQDTAEYVAELAIMHYDIVAKFRSAVIAAASLLVACRNLPFAVPKCVDELRMLDNTVELCAADLTRLMLSVRSTSGFRNNLRVKYSCHSKNNATQVFDSISEVMGPG